MAVGAAYFYQGELARSLEVYDEALGLLFEVENSALTASSLVNVALMLVRKGDLRLARYRAEGGMLLAREIGLQDTIGGSSLVLGWIDTLQGNLAAAFRSFDRAEAAFRELGDPKYLAWLCWHRGQALVLRGELEAARRQHEEALALRRQLGVKGFVAESQAALAALDLVAGRPAQAAAEAEDAVAQFAADRQADSEAWAQSLLAEALAAQGRTAEAAPVMARALALTSSGQSRIINIAVRRRAILFQARSEKTLSPTDARRALDGLLAEAAAAEMTVERLELLLAQQLLARGPADRLVPQLRAAAQEARDRDLGLLAEKIDKALQPEGAP
jgi:tetratricopeptide (TPR) repeat protein